jgi:CheY-like chemotaxis protein
LPGAVGRPGVLVDPGHAGDPPSNYMHFEAMAPVVDSNVVALRVLVCDDNEVNRLLLQAYLANLGCDSVMCEDGAQAVALARCNRFDLVLMDLHMPVLDGFGATEEIRALAPRELGPVIVAVTADPLPETRRRADLAGIDDLLAKPLDVDDVAACLRRHFPRTTAHA